MRLFKSKLMRGKCILPFIFLSVISLPCSYASAEFLFKCQRHENDYIEDYRMRIVAAIPSQKAKIYLDERDLDQSDSNGTQIVKSVVVSANTILINIQAQFEPEELGGVTYSAGTVSTQMNLNRTTGKLTKTEEIHGGILGANLGNGTHLSEETCRPAMPR